MKEKFEKMHEEGAGAWFDAGHEERRMIVGSAWPWVGKTVIEIGCGEGDLAAILAASGAKEVYATDYSENAIDRAERKYRHPNLQFHCVKYRSIQKGPYDILVMQGLLEHLDHPWLELKWMIEQFEPKEVIVSAPCFVNPRGYVWMTLATLFKAPMSLTDKHFLHPWDFVKFAEDNKLHASMLTCEQSWGNGPKMLEDFKKRLPKVFQDMGTPIKGRLSDLFTFLDKQANFLDWREGIGAVAVYKLTKEPQK